MSPVDAFRDAPHPTKERSYPPRGPDAVYGILTSRVVAGNASLWVQESSKALRVLENGHYPWGASEGVTGTSTPKEGGM